MAMSIKTVHYHRNEYWNEQPITRFCMTRFNWCHPFFSMSRKFTLSILPPTQLTVSSYTFSSSFILSTHFPSSLLPLQFSPFLSLPSLPFQEVTIGTSFNAAINRKKCTIYASVGNTQKSSPSNQKFSKDPVPLPSSPLYPRNQFPYINELKTHHASLGKTSDSYLATTDPPMAGDIHTEGPTSHGS